MRKARTRRRRPRSSPPAGRSSDSAPAILRRAFWRSAPLLLTAILALVGALDFLTLPAGGAPIRLGIVILGLVIGIILTTLTESHRSRVFWQVMLGSVLVLIPVLALQASAARSPFVALARSSAGPLMSFTVAALAVLVGIWLFAVYQADEAPENAALIFLPAALLAPAMLGAGGSLDETATLTMLSEASFVAGLTVFLAMLAAPSWRPIAGGVALGAQFVMLWVMGRGPVIGEHAGWVVPFCAALLIGASVTLTVLAPLAALFSRRFFQTVGDESGATTLTSAPPRGARRKPESE